jgi:hypothetical protein
MNSRHFRLQYRGSIFWLIFWLIFVFPIGLVLLFTDSTFEWGQKSYTFHYNGSRFWLCFWVLVFFPIAILLLILNGLSINIQNRIDSRSPRD